MRGLIEKDLRLTFSRKQTLLVFLIMALVMGLSMDGSFLIGYLVMLATVVAVGTLSYDEFDNGLPFLMTLPFERKTYVMEKYLFSLMLAAAAWCVGTVLYCAGNVVRPGTGSLPDELPMLLALLPTLYLSSAIMIPLQLKYGSEKSKIILFIIFGAIAVLVFAGGRVWGSANNPLQSLARTLEGFAPGMVLLALTAICALAACVSCLLSIRIMEKKEF